MLGNVASLRAGRTDPDWRSGDRVGVHLADNQPTVHEAHVDFVRPRTSGPRPGSGLDNVVPLGESMKLAGHEFLSDSAF
jgi:hypothetical protein